MARQVTATEAKANLLRLLEAVAAGEEVEITKHGHTLARLIPARGGRAAKGRLSGRARTLVAEDELFGTGERWNES